MGCNGSSLAKTAESSGDHHTSAEMGCNGSSLAKTGESNGDHHTSSPSSTTTIKSKKISPNLQGPDYDTHNPSHSNGTPPFEFPQHEQPVGAQHPNQRHATLSRSWSFEGDNPDSSIIPGLPNDLAQLCLMHVPFVKFNASLKRVSKQWREILSSEEFYMARSAMGISETFISFVVHGSKVQIFSLKYHSWFCLPPLPWRRTFSGDWQIDPYEGWQIETVAALEGTLYVMGGDQATFNCIPSTIPASLVHKYDFCSNKWIKVAPMHIPRSNSAAVALEKKILVAGGNDKMEEGASAEIYDSTTNCWNFVSRMHSSMKSCVGIEHRGLVYVKGTNQGSGSPIEAELYDPLKNLWVRMNPVLRRGLAAGPIASANCELFVADWKDSLLKMYIAETDSWQVVAGLPEKLSRLVGHKDKLYGLTGKIKIDPFNHNVISDSPDGVWQLDLQTNCRGSRGTLTGSVSAAKILCHVSFKESTGNTGDLTSSNTSSRTRFHFKHTEDNGEYVWKRIWRETRHNRKSGSLSWVPCSAHCALLED